MDVIKSVRELGKAIQQDQRFIRYAKARLEIPAEKRVSVLVA